jgi:hypothetical protein
MHIGALMQLLSGSVYGALLAATAELRIAELLSGGPLAAEEIARRASADPRSMGRLLRALSVMGLIGVDGDRYVGTPTLAWLREDFDGSLRSLALLGGEPAVQAAWLRCAEAIRTGQTAFELAHGRPLFEFLDEHDRLRERFQGSMSGPAAWNQAVVEAIDLQGRSLAVDVGAGDGRLLRALLASWPELKGIAFDRPPVVARHEQPEERMAWASGDFFTSVPEGGDAYLLRWILHDWPDGRAVEILTRCREAMTANGILLVIENTMGETLAEQGSALLDVTMLVLTGGLERTEAEYARLFERAGLRLESVTPTPAGLKVLRATRSS